MRKEDEEENIRDSHKENRRTEKNASYNEKYETRKNNNNNNNNNNNIFMYLFVLYLTTLSVAQYI
jgi:hypothetical protein